MFLSHEQQFLTLKRSGMVDDKSKKNEIPNPHLFEMRCPDPDWILAQPYPPSPQFEVNIRGINIGAASNTGFKPSLGNVHDQAYYA